MDRVSFYFRYGLQGFLLILVFFILSSCSTSTRKKDGPPNFYVDERKIPNAVPRPEPLAKYGNMRSYRVFGKRYYTMKSSRNYEEVGVASWYGTQFHAHSTSSGERYNMLAMTAAHKTLPLPTYVEVTNLKNRRKIIVKVNDRGPFESNRLIDLSYVAAKKLGMLGRGTTRVRVRAIDPYHYGERYVFAKNLKQDASKIYHLLTQSSKSSANLYLQVGAFRNKNRAEKLRQHLITKLAAPIKIFSPTHLSKLYRVQIGPFQDKVTAKKVSQQLRSLGIKPAVQTM